MIVKMRMEVLMEKEEKIFEIIEGDGSNINMSPVSDYIVSIKPKKKKTKKVVIPKEKKPKKKE